MKKFKLLALFISVLLCLQSCGVIVINDSHTETSAEMTDTETDTATETEEPNEIIIDKKTSDSMKKNALEMLDQLDTVNAAGMHVLIATTDKLFYEGDSSFTPLTSDRVVRIEKIEEKLGTSVTVIKYSEQELYDKLYAAAKSKNYFADVLAVPVSLVGKLASDGLVKSLRAVAGLDLKADYFNKDSMAALSGGHSLYALSGEGCFEPEKMYCVYFNKEIAKKLGLDLYSLVSEGKWTLEAYARCVSAAASAGNGAAVMKNAENYKKMLLTGSGFDYADSGTDKTPAANTFSEEYENIVKLLAALPEAVGSSSPSDAFLSGSSLFYIDTVFSAEKMSDSSLVWGMLPFPKYSEEAGYSTYISEDATVLCVPVYAADERLSADLIEALNASSVDYIKYDYIYHNMLDVLRDNGSVNSLNIIINNPNFDFVTAMRSGFPTLYANTAGVFDDLLSGKLSFEEYKEREPEVIEYMEKWFPVKYK